MREAGRITALALRTVGEAVRPGVTTSELDAIYSAVEEELRSQYLLAYQSTNTSGGGDFRTVEVDIPGRDAEARKCTSSRREKKARLPGRPPTVGTGSLLSASLSSCAAWERSAAIAVTFS